MLLAGAVTGGLGVAMAPPAAAHGACKYPGERVSRLTASGKVPCATARAVAAAYDAAQLSGGDFPDGAPVPSAGFSCRTTQVGDVSEESFSVRCAGRRGVVRFAWGV